MRLFAGRKLDYEPKHCKNKKTEQDFMTAIEFSADCPYGRAVALIDFKRGVFEVYISKACIVFPFIYLLVLISFFLVSRSRMNG